jgi:hypothetical protein
MCSLKTIRSIESESLRKNFKKEKILNDKIIKESTNLFFLLEVFFRVIVEKSFYS